MMRNGGVKLLQWPAHTVTWPFPPSPLAAARSIFLFVVCWRLFFVSIQTEGRQSLLRMLSLNQTFDDTRNIKVRRCCDMNIIFCLFWNCHYKVLVVPIGNNSLFDHHFQVVSRLRDIPFYELNRPVSKSGNPAFKFFNWNNGNLLFDYLRYDRVPRGPGDLDNFQVNIYEFTSVARLWLIMYFFPFPSEFKTCADDNGINKLSWVGWITS